MQPNGNTEVKFLVRTLEKNHVGSGYGSENQLKSIIRRRIRKQSFRIHYEKIEGLLL